MSREATCRGGWWCALQGALLGAAICAFLPGLSAIADDTAAAAAQLSNQAFAILNSLNAAGADGTTSPVLGQVASFAGDAQTLSQALSKGDRAGAGRAMASLKSDEAALDAALKAHRGAVKTADWQSLKQQLAALEKRVPPAPATAASTKAGSSSAASAPPSSSLPPAPAASTAAAGSESATPPPASGGLSGASTASASAPARGASKGPQIEISSRALENGVTHIKGFFEGTNLKSAGLYEGARRIKPIKIDHILGLQKIEFDLALNGADIATNLRVYDHAGRRAIASVYGGDTTALAGSNEVAGVEVDRGSGATAGSNTAEIPSHNSESLGGGDSGSFAPGSSSLGGGGLAPMAPMGNVQINISAVNLIDPMTHVYQVTGQIAGRGVRHAGIYVDGRLVKRVPVASGASISSFNTTFIMNGGTATIRAFGAGSRYVETSIQMPAATAPPMVASPYYSPYGASPYAMSPYGSYGSSPSFSINIGPGAISPYGMSPFGMSPYGGISPYGGMYGSPYGMSPYASPYGVSPYGAYSAPPAAAHPWGNAPAPPSASGR